MDDTVWLVEYMANTIDDANGGHLQSDDAADCAAHIRRYMGEEIGTLVNQAADDVLDEIGVDDEGSRDTVNLVVNTILARWTSRGMNVREVIESNYDETPEEVLGWCR